MSKIAVFTDENRALCDFFEACKFLFYEKKDKWEVTGEADFERITPSSPAKTRKAVSDLLPLINGCEIIAGGTLVGIPYSVFNIAGLHIFEIGEIADAVFDGITEDIESNIASRKKSAENSKPVETDTPGVYALDLIALQSEFPEISSKKAMADFLENTPFLELRLICKHVPPWIENSGKYNVAARDNNEVVITRRC